MNWISVKDELPPCEKELLICTNLGSRMVAVYEDGSVSTSETKIRFDNALLDYYKTRQCCIEKGWWLASNHYALAVYDVRIGENIDIIEQVVYWAELLPMPNKVKE